MFRILKSNSEVEPFLSDVVNAADRLRIPLGFTPRGAYETNALKGNLWVALHAEDESYAGHLLFGGRYPDLRIFQVAVKENFRGSGVGKALIEDLTKFGQQKDYLSIIARVASDLEANDFWERIGFQTVKTVQGGKSRNRTINIRVKPLEVPSLLNFLSNVGNKTRRRDKMELLKLTSPDRRTTTFAIDVNVLLEVLRDRSRVDEARRLIQQAVSGSLRLFLTQEFSVEAARQNTPSAEDQLLNFASQMGVLPQPPEADLHVVVSRLREIVFPGRPLARKSFENDESDLKHIAHAIYFNLNGFVTFDKQLLRSHEAIEEEFGIEILTPSEFWQDQEVDSQFGARIRLGEQDVRFVETTFNEEHALFLSPEHQQQSPIAPHLPTEDFSESKKSIDVRLGERTIGVSSWTLSKRPRAETSLYISLDQESSITEVIVQHLIETTLYLGSSRSSRTMKLVLPRSHSTSITLAKEMGFHAPPYLSERPELITLLKVVAPSLVTPDNWQSFNRQVLLMTTASLPERMPTEKSVESNGIRLDLEGGSGEFLDRVSFERLFRPSLFLFPGRTGVLVPIRPPFAQDLLGYDNNQPRLFATQQAMIRTERVYFRSTKNSDSVKAGMPIIFYVSEVGKAVGCAIVKSSINIPWADARVRFEGQGVLNQHDLEEMADLHGMIHVFSFFSYQPFSSPVAIRTLKELGLGKANFVTFEKINNSALSELCYEGLSLGG